MPHILTVDVEDWFHTQAVSEKISVSDWEKYPVRIHRNVARILELFNRRQTRATFFVLGWIAEKYPELIEQIDQAGHEIASHGYRHRLISTLGPVQFKDYVERSKKILEDLSGTPVWGYRATSFSIVKQTLWALDCIKEAGFVYDSSIFPIRHDIYGIDGFPRFPYAHENGLIEIPPSTLHIWGRNIPFAGGGYFRLYPYWLTKIGFQNLNNSDYPVLVYLHPWEFDPGCPKVKQADWRTRFRQYINLNKTEDRFVKLLADFHFEPIKQYIENALPTIKTIPIISSA